MSTFIEDNADLPLIQLMLARRNDPPTAKAAGRAAASFNGDHERRILAALEAGPAHRDEIARRAGMGRDAVWRRLAAMERRGAIVKVGEARGDSGCRQAVYRRATT